MDGIIAYILSKKYTDKVCREILDAGFKVQVEQDRSILETSGQEKILYLLPKESEDSGDGYDEYIYANNSWEQVGSTEIDLSAYALKSEIIEEIYIGEETPSGEEVLWIDTRDDSTPSVNSTVFGVVWDYSLSSPELTRLTPESDPLGVVTAVPEQEPTACIGTEGGQSDFDNYFPWKGMQRYNYVNGEIVDFVSYGNGETFVYIPEFWSKIINDSEESKMYIYISDSELNGFTLHPGSGRYVGRYGCNSNFLSAPGTTPKVNTNLGGFRTGITAIDNKHYQYDIHTYNALELLYIVEFANLNTQATIGAGITSGDTILPTGETDILAYHTGRINGTTNDVSAIQYRWIENLWGNVCNWVDGILIQNTLVYICNDRANYANSITNDYESTGLYTPTVSGWHKTDQAYNNCYLIPFSVGGSDSTYTCDHYSCSSGLRGLFVGDSYNGGSDAGLFYWFGRGAPSVASAVLGGRSILVLNNGGN